MFLQRTSPPAATILKHIQYAEDRLKRSLVIVEVGSIKELNFEALIKDGHSTLYIARYVSNVVRRKHKFYSIDKDTITAKAHIDNKKLTDMVSFVNEDWREGIKQIPEKLDVVYLDTDEEPSAAVEQFDMVYDKMNKDGIIIVDDIDQTSTHSQKGRFLIPLLQHKNISMTFENAMMIVRA